MHTRIAGGCLYHASVALGKPINKTAAKTINFSFCRCGLVIIPYKFYIVVITGCDVVGVNLIYKDIILSNT